MGPHFADMYSSSDDEEPKRPPDRELDGEDEDSEKPSSRFVTLLGADDCEPIEGDDEDDEGVEESKGCEVTRPVGFMGTGKTVKLHGNL